jgi:hypothetical protein
VTRALLTFLCSTLIAPCSFPASLEWDSTGEPAVAGYKAYIGTISRTYDRVIDVGNATRCELAVLTPGVMYFLAATAYDGDGLESDFSEEITYTPQPPRPRPLTALRVVISPPPPLPTLQVSTNLADWSDVLALTNAHEFFRVQ